MQPELNNKYGGERLRSEQRPPLCELLVDAGKLTAANVIRALRLQNEQQQHEPVGSILVKLGLVSERDVAEGLSAQLGVPLIEKARFPQEPAHRSKISGNFLVKSAALILDEDDDELTLVMADPRDQFVIDAVRLCTGKKVVPCIGIRSEIEASCRQAYSNEEGAAAADISSIQFEDDVEQLKELAGEAPVVRLVNQIITDAAECNASDIHIEPFEGGLVVRYRVDGLLRRIDAPHAESSAAVISRVKIMANMNIAERRLAQDGRFKHQVRGINYDFRVSTVPTMHGESVVLRLLRRDQVELDFATLGFTDAQTAAMHEALAVPHGIVLVTGPTGSGKSTTLYAALTHLNDPQRMIITVEDPVEYNIAGINQMAVKPQIGLSFANALRSIVRQDPDVIMIGEMRDGETAQIAVQSALTGHLVLSTLHTNDAPSSVMRMLDLGVHDYLLTTAVNMVQAQRLVRKLCETCREAYRPMDEIVERWDLSSKASGGSITLYRAVGCSACAQTGYSGRTAILEILKLTDSIRGMILKREATHSIRSCAIAEGMVPMRDDGIAKALAGTTTIEEVLRVTPEQST